MGRDKDGGGDGEVVDRNFLRYFLWYLSMEFFVWCCFEHTSFGYELILNSVGEIILAVGISDALALDFIFRRRPVIISKYILTSN